MLYLSAFNKPFICMPQNLFNIQVNIKNANLFHSPSINKSLPEQNNFSEYNIVKYGGKYRYLFSFSFG